MTDWFKKLFINEAKPALDRHSGVDPKPEQTKTVDITENGSYSVTADEGYSLTEAKAIVNVPIPDGYVKPSGMKVINTNGLHDVSGYEEASVSVPPPSGYVKPAGNLKVTQNASYDVYNYSTVTVDVESEQPQLLAPTLSISGDTLTIADNAGNGSFVTEYDIYVNGSVVATVAAN